jgi:ribosomal protein S12 methylthiotransferase accessory factor
MRGRPSAAIPPQWLPFVGRRLGLVKLLSRLSVDPEDFDIHHVFPTKTALGDLLGDPREFEPRAGGAGLTREDAVNRAIGELLERYAALAYQGNGRITSSFNGLAGRGYQPVPFETLTLFSREQYLTPGFPCREFTKETPLTWFEGIDLCSGSAVYVPGQLISLGYVPDAGEVAGCFYSTSCGCALATSVEGALLTGLLEFIERDAVMVRWYARLAPPGLDLSSEELLGRPLRRQTRALEIRFYDLTVDGEVPVVCVGVGERTGRSCALIFGTAAGLDTETAARKALLEAGQGRPFVKLLAELGAARGEGEVFDDFDSNVRFFAEPANAGYVEWFAQNTARSGRYFPAAETASEPPAVSVRLLLDRCAKSGLTPIAFDLTTPELRDHGLFACRVFIPELVPLCIPSAPFFGHPRLAHRIAEARQTGLSVSLPAWLPHPFA